MSLWPAHTHRPGTWCLPRAEIKILCQCQVLLGRGYRSPWPQQGCQVKLEEPKPGGSPKSGPQSHHPTNLFFLLKNTYTHHSGSCPDIPSLACTLCSHTGPAIPTTLHPLCSFLSSRREQEPACQLCLLRQPWLGFSPLCLYGPMSRCQGSVFL